VAANYAFTYTAGTVTVARKGAVVTASDSNVTYGDPIPTVTPAYSGLVNGEGAGVINQIPVCTTNYTVFSDYGTTPTTSCSAAGAANYSFSYVGGTITIYKKNVVVTASSTTVAYGANVPGITPSYVGWVNAQGPSVLTQVPLCSTTYQSTDGILVIPSTSCAGADALNYTFSYTNGSVTIIRKNVNITASSDTAVYGDASVATPTPSYSGFVNGQNQTILTTAPTCSTTYQSTSSVAAGAATNCSGATAANYSFTYIPGTITVTRKGVVVTASSPTVSYGSSPPAISMPSMLEPRPKTP
jgi:hypothetical protein